MPKESDNPLSPNITRRSFLGGLTTAAMAGVIWPDSFIQAASNGVQSDLFGELLPMRPLGETGEKVTLLGIGGQHYRWLPENQLEEAMEVAIEGGIRFFDTANAYGRDQLSERLYGQYLTPKYREAVFLMTKTSKKNAGKAREDLELSLRHMKTDVLDLWQLHNITSIEDAHRRWDAGVVDVFIKAQEEGKVRMIGFTGHHNFRAHLEMLKLFDQRGVKVQTVQMPVNVVDPAYDSFIKEVIPLAQKMGVGLLAMKTMCGGRLFGGYGEGWGQHGKTAADPLVPDIMPLRDAADYVWSLPVSTRIVGFDNTDQLREHIRAAKQLRQLSPQQQADILQTAAQRSGPVMEFYKKDTHSDTTSGSTPGA
jgi:aryl-alcohol dehydrogenase-like predicted oxidoreductase